MTKHEKNFFSNFFKKELGSQLTDNSCNPFIYAMYDSKTHQFMDPFICPNTDFAKRSVNQLFVSGAKTLVTQFPNDFFLYCLGEYNNNNGYIKSDIECICCCADFYIPEVKVNDVKDTNTSDKVVDLFPVKEESEVISNEEE